MIISEHDLEIFPTLSSQAASIRLVAQHLDNTVVRAKVLRAADSITECLRDAQMGNSSG